MGHDYGVRRLCVRSHSPNHRNIHPSLDGELIGADDCTTDPFGRGLGLVEGYCRGQETDPQTCYRIPIAVQFAWAIILVVGMLILPETPRFLIKQDISR
jgi:hypothetical protein